MLNKVEVNWWGVRVYLDEANTQLLLAAIDSGSSVSSVVSQFAPDARTKAMVTVATAMVKISGTVIKFVDQRGGSHGVCIWFPWNGVIPGWVRPQAA